MNIAFDAVAIAGITRDRGIGHYLEQLTKHMVMEDAKNQYFLFNCIDPCGSFESSAKNFKEEYFYLGRNFILADQKEFPEIYGELLKSFLKKNQIDVFCIGNAFTVGNLYPTSNQGNLPLYKREWFLDTRVLVVVHDLIPWIFKEKYLDQIARKHFQECAKQIVWADLCLTNSAYTQSDLIKYLDIKKGRTCCIGCGYKRGTKKIDIHSQDWTYMQRTYGITPGFIMAPLGEDFRKNIDALIRAYAMLSMHEKKKHQLVIVCALSPEAEDRFEAIAKEEKCEEYVIITNFVTDEVMLKLYNMADLVAFPSLYEGFGMPIVEAFACGTPVLTSNNSSCKEVAGDAAYLVNPFSVEDIYRGLEEALVDVHRDRMIELGYQQLKKFQWEKVAENALRAIESVLPEINASKSCKKKESQLQKKKMACFVSLNSGTLHKNDAEILHMLSNFYDIDIYVDEDLVEPNHIEDFHNVYSYEIFEETGYTYIYYRYRDHPSNSFMKKCIRNTGGILDFVDGVRDELAGYGRGILVHETNEMGKLLKKNIGLNVYCIENLGKEEKSSEECSRQSVKLYEFIEGTEKTQSLTERLMNKVHRVIKENGYTNDEIMAISKTLSYIK